MLKVIRFIFTLSLLWLATAECNARIVNASASGIWESSATWGGLTPACGDTLHIGAGRIVQITTVLDYTLCSSPIRVVVTGTLSFQTGKKLRLTCTSVVEVVSGGWIVSGSGGGNSNLIEICTTIVWNTAMGNLPGPVILSISPLPVSLAYFTATEEKDHINLQWVTLTEVNNECFILERSTDGKEFTLIARITGSGTSSNTHRYAFKDHTPVQGVLYYQLLQKDFDGKITTFKPVAVRWENESSFSFYPNPGKGELFAAVPQHFAKRVARLVIQDMQSVVVVQKDISIGDKVGGIPLISKSEMLKPGNYLASLMVDDQKFTRIIMIQ